MLYLYAKDAYFLDHHLNKFSELGNVSFVKGHIVSIHTNL